MSPIEFVKLIVLCLSRLANATNKAYTLAYIMQKAKCVAKDGKIYPLNNADNWQYVTKEKMGKIASDIFVPKSLLEVFELKVNVLFMAIASAKQADRVKIAHTFAPHLSDEDCKKLVKLALSVNDIMHYDSMTAKAAKAHSDKVTTDTGKTY